jgi:transposase
VWVLGAFEPVTGLATTLYSPRRDSASFTQLLEQVLQTYPTREWVLITDNLSTHHARDTQTALIAWPEVELRFIPTYACWLNLIEPWWKQLRSLALKGLRFEKVGERFEAVVQATAYWNQHRYLYVWKKAIQFRNKTSKLSRVCSRHCGIGERAICTLVTRLLC